MLLHRSFLILTTSCMCLISLNASGQQAIQKQLDAAKPGASISIPAGTYQEPLSITQPVTLKGNERDQVVLEITSNQPAIRINAKRRVVLESMTIRWQLESSDDEQSENAAIWAKDSQVTLRNCRIVALGNPKRCPMGLTATGFSNVTIENCELEGFDFTVAFSGGAEGEVTGSVIRNMGHCGISVYEGSKVRIADNLITGSRYHGIRCTGGELLVFNNLIVKNANRGIYLGNKSARGRIRNNVIMANGTGIGSFANSEVTIHNNLILDSEFAGLGSRNSCKLVIKNNIFQGNTQGIVQFAESGRSNLQVAGNCFWQNDSPAKDINLPKSSMMSDPQLADLPAGRFEVTAENVKKKKHGLSKSAPLSELWVKYQAMATQPGQEVSAR